MNEQAFAGVVRRDPDQKMRGLLLTDGREDLLHEVAAAAKRYRVDIVLIQDPVHVLEYLRSAAYPLHPHDAEEHDV